MSQTCQSSGVGEYVASERHSMRWARTYKFNGTKRLGIVHPGFTSTALTWTFADQNLWLPPVEVGHPMCSADFSDNDEFGNDTAQTRTEQLRVFAGPALNAIYDKPLLLGGSMGGLSALNYATFNPTKCQALALFVPLVDPQNLYDNDWGGFASDVDAAYGGRPPDAYTPATHPEDFAQFPGHIWYSTDDPLIPQQTVLDFAEGAGWETTSLGAVGHAVTGIDVSEVLTFLDENS